MIPRHKQDIEAVEHIAGLSSDELASLAPKLMPWLQDGNWPVAAPLAAVLALSPEAVLPAVVQVLRGTDPIWKFWCIELLVKALPAPTIRALSKELEPLARFPTPEELAEEVNLAAQEALAKGAA